MAKLLLGRIITSLFITHTVERLNFFFFFPHVFRQLSIWADFQQWRCAVLVIALQPYMSWWPPFHVGPKRLRVVCRELAGNLFRMDDRNFPQRNGNFSLYGFFAFYCGDSSVAVFHCLDFVGEGSSPFGQKSLTLKKIVNPWEVDGDNSISHMSHFFPCGNLCGLKSQAQMKDTETDTHCDTHKYKKKKEKTFFSPFDLNWFWAAS